MRKIRRWLNQRPRDWTGMVYCDERFAYRETLPVWKLALWRVGKYLIKFGEK